MQKNSSVVDAAGKRRGKVINFFDGFGISIVSVEGVLTKQKFFSVNGDDIEFSIPKWWPNQSSNNSN